MRPRKSLPCHRAIIPANLVLAIRVVASMDGQLFYRHCDE
jgi:hypothetical protein